VLLSYVVRALQPITTDLVSELLRCAEGNFYHRTAHHLKTNDMTAQNMEEEIRQYILSGSLSGEKRQTFMPSLLGNAD